MKKKLLKLNLLILILAAHFTTLAQNYNWAYSIGGLGTEVAKEVALDADGNVFVTGYFNGSNVDFDPTDNVVLLSSTGNYDAFFAKYTSAGICLWARSFATGSTFVSAGTDIEIDPFGDAYVAGYFTSPVLDLDVSSGVTTYSNQGEDDIFLVKYDADGNFIWGNAIGGDKDDRVTDIALFGKSAVFISGTYKSTSIDFNPDPMVIDFKANSGATTDAFVARYFPLDGDYSTNFVVGNGSACSIKAMTVIGSDLYVTGSFNGNNFDLDPSNNQALCASSGSTDFFIAKYTSLLAFQSRIELGGTGADLPADLNQDAAGNIIISGTFSGVVDFDPLGGVTNLTSAGSTDIFMARYNANLALDWAKQIGGSLSDGNNLKLAIDASDNLYLSGNFSSVDADFNPSISVTTLTTNNSTNKLFFAKYTSLGGYLYAKLVDNVEIDNGGYAYGCAVSYTGDFYMVGSFYGANLDFDPSTSTANLSSANPPNDFNFYIAKYSKMQNQSINFPTLPYKVMGDGAFYLNATASSSLTVNYSSSNKSVATISGNILSVVGQGSTIITASQPGNSIYNAAPSVMQVFTVGLSAINELNQESLTVYPNPTHGMLYFTEPTSANAVVEISSTTGLLVKATKIDSNTNSLDVSGLATGIYFLKVMEDNKINVTKIVIE